MRSYPSPVNLLAEIESRQDDVLARLDQLNARVEQLLSECGAPLNPHEVARAGGSSD